MAKSKKSLTIKIYKRRRDGSLTANVSKNPHKGKGKAFKVIKVSNGSKK